VVRSDGVLFFHVAPDNAVDRGADLAEEWQPHILHLHSAWLWPVAQVIQARTGAPMVFTVHSLDRAEYEIGELPTDWIAQEEAMAGASRIIAVSSSESALICRYCPAVAGRVRVVGNGIADSRQARQAVGNPCPEPDPLVLYSGRFVARKGIEGLLATIPKILDRTPKVQFVLVGGYGGGPEIEQEWLKESLTPYKEQIRFTGWLLPDEVNAWYRRADVLVVPSWYEPFGMVILEGMLHGLAIAASAVGGPAEILEHDLTALLFPPRDVEALSRCLLRLVLDPDLRIRLGEAAAAEVRRRWLWPQQAARMEGVYREVLPSR